MTSPTDSKTNSFITRPMPTSLWGEFVDDQPADVRGVHATTCDEEPMEEGSESREETMEDEDDIDDEDEEGEEASVDEDDGSGESRASPEMDSNVSAISQPSQSATGEAQKPQHPSMSIMDSALPKEIEALIQTAYKPEGPKVIFPFRMPDTDDSKEDEEVPYEYCRSNDIVHHTIRLNQHFRVMSALLHIAQITKGMEYRKFPSIPDMIIRKRKVKKFKRFHFTVPIYQHPKPYLEKKTIQKMLQKSVVIILAQLGVDKASKSVVLVLVDVVKEFLRKLCLTCNTYCQWDLTKGHMDFRAIMERALVDMGLRKGQKDIKEYCENIVTRRNRAFRRNFHLVRLYLKTVYAARMKARLLGTPTNSRQTAGRQQSTKPTLPLSQQELSMYLPRGLQTISVMECVKRMLPLPQQGLSMYLPRGMQTITVMERARPYIRKFKTFPTSAPAPMLFSKFTENYSLKKKEPPPELSAILRPASEAN